jgi:hypothetical protein
MRRMKTRMIAINGMALLTLLGAANSAMAQSGTTRYPRMAPVEQYLMDRTAEIALARTAAPASISRDASVLVLGRHGFETAVTGKNGFVCYVDRGWSSAPDPDFWNPKVRVPQCENAPGARSHLPIVLKRAELALAGHTKEQVESATTAAIASGALPPMERGAISYMMSKLGYAGDSSKHWPSHVMFFYSRFDPANWGANLPGSPVLAMEDPVNHLTGFAITLQQWSDGTDAR